MQPNKLKNMASEIMQNLCVLDRLIYGLKDKLISNQSIGLETKEQSENKIVVKQKTNSQL